MRLSRPSALFILSWLLFLLSPAANADALEQEVKAAYVYKFAGYVEWPQPLQADQPVKIAVLQAEPIVHELRKLLHERSINGHPAVVDAIASLEELSDQHILYVGGDANDLLREWTPHAAGKAVLIISEMPNALQAGSMINFVLVDRRLRFEIAQAASERAGLKLSARLLSAAVAVHKQVPP